MSSTLIPRLAHIRPLRSSSSSFHRCSALLSTRALASTALRSDILNEVEKQLHPRELIERKKREFEEKYGDKLKQKIEAEGVQDLEELKKKVIAPSVRAELKRRSQSKGRARQFEPSAANVVDVAETPVDQGRVDQESLPSPAEYETAPKHGLIPDESEESKQLQYDRAGAERAVEQIQRDARERDELASVAEYETAPKDGLMEEKSGGGRNQAEGDRSGIKPLSSIINLPLLHLTPHDAAAISQIWTAYHATHPTMSSSFLSASVPAKTYKSMLELARRNPFFVLPLPRLAEEPTSESTAPTPTSQVKTDEYEMFYLQWLFHPTPTTSSPPSPDLNPEPLPLTTSIIFTPLEEFKKSGEWAQPYLVLTHYPDLAQTHSLVLMRGEISPAAASSGSAGSLSNPGFLLSQQQAQLLALALQRFYCTGLEVSNEGEKGRAERIKRAEALVGFRERPGEWDWKGLVDMAYGGLV
ncbi:hypothetical protein IAR55_006748 [Kwoniella newhampshirensis]|uniref:ATP synthase mitochondrial F1 complex assembly factor 1 n=1 Tax=Kwoniella newhampshirensis TaxID=1651941 RepID=A0AAW0YDA8_9TREE